MKKYFVLLVLLFLSSGDARGIEMGPPVVTYNKSELQIVMDGDKEELRDWFVKVEEYYKYGIDEYYHRQKYEKWAAGCESDVIRLDFCHLFRVSIWSVMGDAPEDRRVMLYYSAFQLSGTLGITKEGYQKTMKRVVELFNAGGSEWKAVMRDALLENNRCEKKKRAQSQATSR